MHEVVGEVIASSSSDVARGDIAVGGRAPWPGWGETSASMPPVWRRTPSGVRRRRCCSSRSRVRSTLRTRSGRSPGTSRRPWPGANQPSPLARGEVAGASWVTGIDRVSRADSASTFGVDGLIHHSTDRWVHALRDDDRPDVVIEAIAHGLARSLTRFRPWHLMLWSTTSALLTTRCAFHGRDASQEPRDQGGDCDATVPAGRHSAGNRSSAGSHRAGRRGRRGRLSFANAQDAYAQVSTPKMGQHKVVNDV